MKRINYNFSSLAEDWLIYKKYSIKNSTYYRYKYIIENYLCCFQNLTLNDLKKYNFNKFIEKLSLTLSTKTVKDIVVILKSILKYGERKYNFDFKLDLISNLRYSQKELKILDDKEFRKLENFCLNNVTLKNAGILLCLHTGVRVGEICALKWNDIDFKNREIRINKTMQRICVKNSKSFINIDDPKSQKSNRVVPIANKLFNSLKK